MSEPETSLDSKEKVGRNNKSRGRRKVGKCDEAEGYQKTEKMKQLIIQLGGYSARDSLKRRRGIWDSPNT